MWPGCQHFLWFGVQVRLGHNYGILLPHVTFSYFPGILDLGFQFDQVWGRMLVSLFLQYIRRSLQMLPVMAPSITYNAHQVAGTVFIQHIFSIGLPRWLSGEEAACTAGDLASIPGSGRCPGGGNGTHSSILAGESHGQRSLAGYSPQGHKESDTTECAHAHTHTHTHTHIHLSYCPPIYFISSLKRCWRGPTKTQLVT